MTLLAPAGDEALGAHVERCVRSFASEASLPLSSTLATFLSTREIDLAGAPLANFTRTAQPVVHLPIWIAEIVRASGLVLPAGAIESAVEAAVFGYLCAQVQGDGLRGRLGPTAHWVFLAHALFARHGAALLIAADSAGAAVSALAAAAWVRHARGSARLWDPEASRAWQGEERASAAERSGPMVLPAAALLAGAGQSHRLPELEALVRSSTEAAQLIDDLLDASEDRERGRITDVVQRWGGQEGATALRRNLYLAGGFEQVLDEAHAALDAARGSAAALGTERGIAYFQEAIGRVEALRARHLETLGRAIFG